MLTFEWVEGEGECRTYGMCVRHEDVKDVDSSLASSVCDCFLTSVGEFLACVGLDEFQQDVNGCVLQILFHFGEILEMWRVMR